VAIYVDGVYYASTAGANLDFIDLSQIEVLKGPQGTLFGRNATGGLIQITTKDPSRTPTLDADVGYGNYGTSKAHFYLAGGLSDDLAASISAEASTQDQGYGRNFYNGKDVNRLYDDLSLRSKLLWTPASGSSVTASFDYAQNRNSFAALRVVPGTLPAPPTGPTYGGTPWDTDSDAQPILSVRTGGASVKYVQELGFGSLSDQVAYRRTFTQDDFDHDATAAPFQTFIVPQAEHQVSNELQLQSVPHDFVTWTGGLYFIQFVGAAPGLDVEFPGGRTLDPLYPINNVVQRAKQTVTSGAAYGQATVPLFDATNLTLGARYTWERHELTGVETGDIGVDPVATLASVNATKDFDRPSYRVALEHRLTEQEMIYASFNTGFKSGGYNPDTITNPVFEPETLQAYEVGLKSDLLDNRLRANIAGFFYDYKNMQVQNLGAKLTTEVVNAAGAHISGADLDLEAQVTPDFNLHGGVEYLHARFTSFPDAPISSPLGTTPVYAGSAAGNPLPFAPTAVLALGADYLVRNVLTGDLDLAVNYTHNTGYSFEPDNVIRQPAFNELNASVRWKSREDRYTVTLWGKNLTNAVISDLLATETFGTHEQLFNPPRTYGIVFGYHY
jgi:outer membrane receptor protein involved in Fe transport